MDFFVALSFHFKATIIINATTTVTSITSATTASTVIDAEYYLELL